MMEDDTPDDWHPLDDIPREHDALLRYLEGRWKAEARRIGISMQVGYAFVREGNAAASLAHIIRAEDVARLGEVPVPAGAWHAAKALCGLARVPFLVVVAQEPPLYAKADFDAPVNAIDGQIRLPLSLFRQA